MNEQAQRQSSLDEIEALKAQVAGVSSVRAAFIFVALSSASFPYCFLLLFSFRLCK